jgi:hypothetical protein
MTRVPFLMSSALVSRVLVTLIRMRDKSDWRSRLKCFGLYEPSMGVDNTGRRYDDEKSVAQLLSRERVSTAPIKGHQRVYMRVRSLVKLSPAASRIKIPFIGKIKLFLFYFLLHFTRKRTERRDKSATAEKISK